jgi:segregation and condensation protein A
MNEEFTRENQNVDKFYNNFAIFISFFYLRFLNINFMYKILLPDFEGPFDLLLYFIKKEEVNIYDIPIARITEEFLKYIRMMQLFDLELAGEFLVMAATLMYIKTQMLLPKTLGEPDSESDDPRRELAQQLYAYMQFKQAASDMASLAEGNRYVYYKQLLPESLFNAGNSGNEYKNATLFDLMKALKTAMGRALDKTIQHVVNLIPISIEEKKNYILENFKLKKRLSFFGLISGEKKQHIVVTFLAILELVKEGSILVRQSDIFDDIILIKKSEPELTLN